MGASVQVREIRGFIFGAKGRAMAAINIERVYDYAPAEGGARAILVDRLWPRGKSKAELGEVLWLKDVAPSNALRTWFGHDPARWDEFRRRYFAELDQNPTVARLRQLASEGPVTLLYGARDEVHNQAAALKEYLERR
jgi:uncharacterized protein YeaO (DUF488 family)